MRRTISLLCFSLVTSACSDPCSRDAKAAFIGLGGPVGLAVALLQQCSAVEATPPPDRVAAPVDEIVPAQQLVEVADMGAADMATPPPDLATAPDLTPPPDLRRAPETVQLQLGAWSVGGLVTATSPTSWHCAAGFDFVRGAPVLCEWNIPLQLPLDAATARSITLTYSVTAALTWATPSSSCAAQGQPNAYLAKSGTSSACLRGSVSAGLVIDGAATSPLLNQTPQQLNAQPQPGVSYPVTPSQRLQLKLALQGDVDVAALSGTVTATLNF